MPNTTDDCGKAGPWKTRKTKGRFSFVYHRPWKSLCDSHIPAVARGTDGKVQIQRQDSHFSTARVPFFSYKTTKKPLPGAGSVRRHFYRGKIGDISNKA